MTLVHARWYPAAVVLPNQRHPWRRTLVIVADDGLHVFRQPGETAQFHAPVNFEKTSIPRTQRDARGGVNIHLAGGQLVVVTPGASCRCGELGRWSGPTWATKEALRR